MVHRKDQIIDLHAHVLPGLDDGPGRLEEAVELLKLLERDGVGTVVATPHVAPGFFWPYDPARMEDKLAELRQAAAAAALEIEVIGGAENYLSPEVVQLAEQGRLPTLGDSRYVLVEFPRREVPFWGFEALERLQRSGYRPILAHPELNDQIRADAELPSDLVRQGVLLQLDASSLAGRWGSRVADFASSLLQSGLGHLVASDAHSARRPPEFRAARQALARVTDRRTAQRLLCDAPAAVVQGVLIEPERRSVGARKEA
ncbi:MAG: phosphotransferase [Bacillota bacterium]|nr:phosphotransferase [Bacillota bacterium]